MVEELRVVIAAVIKQEGKFLVCRRPAHKRHGNLWEFPGGKLEPGESLLEAAERELNEELNMHATACGATLFSIKDEASGFLIKFVEVETTGKPELIEHSALKWMALNQLSELDLAPSDKQFVSELLLRLQ